MATDLLTLTSRGRVHVLTLWIWQSCGCSEQYSVAMTLCEPRGYCHQRACSLGLLHVKCSLLWHSPVQPGPRAVRGASPMERPQVGASPGRCTSEPRLAVIPAQAACTWRTQPPSKGQPQATQSFQLWLWTPWSSTSYPSVFSSSWPFASMGITKHLLFQATTFAVACYSAKGNGNEGRTMRTSCLGGRASFSASKLGQTPQVIWVSACCSPCQLKPMLAVGCAGA